MKIRMMSLAIIAVLFSVTTFAQSSKPSVGIRAGVNFSTIDNKDEAYKNELMTGFNAGLNVEIPLGSSFYVQPGVLYSTKGVRYTDKSNFRLGYLEVPLNFIYKPALGSSNLLLGFGPYAAWGVRGRTQNSTGDKVDIDYDADYNPLVPATMIKRFDAGGNLLAGIEFANKISLQLNGQLGLINIHKASDDNTPDDLKWKNTSWGVSLGFRF